jgi:hypothetical protein
MSIKIDTDGLTFPGNEGCSLYTCLTSWSWSKTANAVGFLSLLYKSRKSGEEVREFFYWKDHAIYQMCGCTYVALSIMCLSLCLKLHCSISVLVWLILCSNSRYRRPTLCTLSCLVLLDGIQLLHFLEDPWIYDISVEERWPWGNSCRGYSSTIFSSNMAMVGWQ